MTRVAGFCFRWKVASIIVGVLLLALFFAPGTIKAAVVMLVATCPVTTLAATARASNFHPCGRPELQSRAAAWESVSRRF